MDNKNEGQLVPSGIEVSGDALGQLTRALDGLTDAVRELSWILLDRWKWQPVQDKDSQAKSMSRAGG